MERDELDDVEDSELDSGSDMDDSSGNSDSSEGADGNTAQSAEAPSAAATAVSLISSIIKLVRSIPSFVYPILFYVLIGLMLLFAILFILTATTVVGEELWEAIHGVGDSVATFMEKAGNFFTGNGFVTNEEEAENEEKKYYQKLQEVHEYYYRRLGVDIDVTMITATLFYGRGMTDYIEDEEIAEEEDAEDAIVNEDGTSADEDVYQGEADFYKLARRHIKTLAKFQIVEDTSFNTCPDTYPLQVKTTPESAEDVAKTWTGFNGWNTRATFNYQTYQSVSYPKIDGSSREITYCEYKDPKSVLTAAYKEDYDIYASYLNAYDTCVTSCEELNGTQTWDPHTREWVTNSCDPDVSCGTAKEKEEEYLSKLHEKWDDVFDISDDNPASASFVCRYSSTWGTLTDYNSLNDQTRKNYKFPEDWVEKGEDPDFWATTLAFFRGEYEPIDCSAKPSLGIQYSTDLTREGVYYHKLLAPHTEFLSSKSFIERYYPDFISDDSDNTYEESVEIVEDIFDLYEFVAEREGGTTYCLYNGQAGIGVGTGTSYSSESVEEFISMIAPTVVQDMQQTGVLASVTIAQAILESTHGTSGLTTKYNNYYGETAGPCAAKVDKSIKGPIPPNTDNNTCTGNKYWDGTIVRMCNKYGEDCQWYRVYNGFENSTGDHSATFLRTNFSYCDSHLSDPHAYVSCLVERPNHKYATDAKYVEKVMSLINTYDLTQYDIGAPSVSTLEGTTSVPSNNNACIPISSGTISGNGAQGIRQSLSESEREPYWGSSNTYYSRNEGQCTWYAFGRGLEILTKNGMTMEEAINKLDATHGHAQDWFANNKYFSSSSDISQPKVGSIIVWGNAVKGHVAVVEDIKYDSAGKIEGVYYSEGHAGTESYGGFNYAYKTLEELQTSKGSGGTYRFIGYIYLLN